MTRCSRTGQNPIEVSGNTVDKDKDGQINVGDQFADAQERSVVVQIGGDGPGCRQLLADSSAGEVADALSERPSDGRDEAGHGRTAYGW